MSVFANTIERLREKNITARSEAWFAYLREEDSNPRLQISRKFSDHAKKCHVAGSNPSHSSPSSTSMPAVELI